MYESIINHMDVDELRSLVTHLQRVDDARGQLVFSQNNIIELFQRLYNDQIYREESRIRLDCKMGALREFERSMEEKYAEYMPVPVCAPEAAADWTSYGESESDG